MLVCTTTFRYEKQVVKLDQTGIISVAPIKHSCGPCGAKVKVPRSQYASEDSERG